ncbi:MAG: glycoside hydrolase family 2 TIM barrel-domain containing protein [Tepidisphaeraceae bacterium]
MPRHTLNLNPGWRFARGEHLAAIEPAYDDAAWQRVNVPHCFDLPYFRTPEFYVGPGWYRRTIEITPDMLRQRVLLNFEGAFQRTDVYLNGSLVDGHSGGYTSFAIDLTGHVHAGTNTLAVRVDNTWNPQLAPRAGEHHFSGGIYRDVRLLCIPATHFAWRGVRVTTPKVDPSRAQVTIQFAVNHAAVACTFAVEVEIIDSQGTTVTRCSTRNNSEVALDVVSPNLWHPEHPHLYTARLRLIEESTGICLDRVDTRFGIRWFEWTADRGFFLNGQHLYLRGANAHQDHAGWGIGITQGAIRRDVQLIKDAGFNFIRGAHYPHHRAFAQACDEIGLICLVENCLWGKGGFGPEGYWNASAYPANAIDEDGFEHSCRETLRAMIRDNVNSPSIVAWSMTNEAFFTFHLDRAKSLVSDLVQLSHELDPTRPAMVGGAQRGGFDRLGDIAGYNGDGARLFTDPGVPNMVTEYGAISKPHDAFEPFFGDLSSGQWAVGSGREKSESISCPPQRSVLPTAHSWRSGEAIWCGFDYGTIAGKQGLKGIIDHFRTPKRSWHWYRKHLRGIEPPAEPIEATPARMQVKFDKEHFEAGGTDDAQITVTLVDEQGRHVRATPPVTLTIESGPGEFPTGRSITFEAGSDIAIVDGQCAMSLRAYEAGPIVVRATSPGLPEASVTLESIGSDDVFVPGETEIVAPRPYVPPAPSEASLAAMRNAVNVALNRPCRSSSEDAQHPARCANDGYDATKWLAKEDDIERWFTVDLEGFYQLASLRVVLPADGPYRFVIEMSIDNANWSIAIDRRNSTNDRAVRNDVFDPGTVARYVRLRFTHGAEGPRAGLVAIELAGILSVR